MEYGIENLVVLIVIVCVFIGLFIKSCIKIVSQSDLFIVERLGRFHKVLDGGFHVIIPIIDRVSAVLTAREQLVYITKQQVITKDNVNIAVDGIVYVKIVEAKNAHYNVENYKDAISNLAMTTLRGEIGAMNLDDTLSSRDKLNASLQLALAGAADNWGVKIMRVEIAEISVPEDIEDAMNMQMKAEREKRAIELKAQAEKEALILKAEALKQEKVLEAEAIERMADAKKYEEVAVSEGQKDAMDNINMAMSASKFAAEYLLAQGRVNAFNELSKSQSKDKILIPYDVTELLGSLSIIKDFLGSKKDEN